MLINIKNGRESRCWDGVLKFLVGNLNFINGVGGVYVIFGIR